MPIPITASRQKLDATVSTTLSIVDKPVVTSGNKLVLPVVLDNIDVGSFTVATVTTTSGQAIVTAANNSFSKVRVGDVVSGTGIPASTTVTAVNGAYSQITLSANATASGAITITVDPEAFDATVYLLELTHVVTGLNLEIKPVLYKMDGTKAANLSAGYDNLSAVASAEAVPLSNININLDKFLSNARIPRTNA